jgi:hypothetical protein
MDYYEMKEDETIPIWLENYSLVCKFCKEELTDYRRGIDHLRSFHLEAYQFWRSQDVVKA